MYLLYRTKRPSRAGKRPTIDITYCLSTEKRPTCHLRYREETYMLPIEYREETYMSPIAVQGSSLHVIYRVQEKVATVTYAEYREVDLHVL